MVYQYCACLWNRFCIFLYFYVCLLVQPAPGQIFPLGNGIYGHLNWPMVNTGGRSASQYTGAVNPYLIPDYGQPMRQQQQQPELLPQQLIVPYGANALWPFPQVGYSNDVGRGANIIDENFKQGSQASPFYGRGWPQQPQYQLEQREQQAPLLNDLIAQLSLALVQSFAQMLAQRDDNGGVSNRNQRENRVFGIPFGQPPQQQTDMSSPGRSSTKYGYGVNAGVFAGTYGGSDNVVSPFGPYGSLNSQIGGGQYSGLSPWPIIPGQFRRPQPQTTSENASIPIASKTGQQQQSAASTGQGSVVQIPLTENVQGGGGPVTP